MRVDTKIPVDPSGAPQRARPLTQAWVKPLLVVSAGVLLLTLGAKVSVPFWPVPMSLQVMALAAIGMTLGARQAVQTVLAYLALGLAGVPVFVSSAGPAAFMGPTGGYLVGFVAAAAVVGSLSQRGWGQSFGRAWLAMLLGLVVLYVPGLAWLGYVVGWDKPVLAMGLTPFILGDALKITLVALALPVARRFRRR